jgi:hypothetical protein
LDRNILLYIALFLIILGLYLHALVRSRIEKSRGREDTAIQARRHNEPDGEPAEKGE